ncbi:MAG TPA: glycosyltransferase [Actinomycetota bacterium]|nr:glycosyltransferase [Actinomycetota bacterium]
MPSGVSVVVATRDRRQPLLDTLGRLTSLPESPPVVVVDNASHDGTVEAVRHRFPSVDVIALDRNLGAAARNVGVACAPTGLVAFSDDDSWWEPGALARSQEILERRPTVAGAAARILLPGSGREDPVCEAMRQTPLASDGLPGPRVLGFLACAAVVRREAFMAVGGFWPPLRIGAEEKLLAIDLAMAGWPLVYREDLVAYHRPAGRDPWARRRQIARNELWISWIRRPVATAVGKTREMIGRGRSDAAVAAGVRRGLAGLPRVLGHRRVVAPALESDLQLVGA